MGIRFHDRIPICFLHTGGVDECAPAFMIEKGKGNIRTDGF